MPQQEVPQAPPQLIPDHFSIWNQCQDSSTLRWSRDAKPAFEWRIFEG